MTEEKLIKSKERKKKFAEVFTPKFIVNDMLNLVEGQGGKVSPDSDEYGWATYLEPACGSGNFLIEILDRKLKWCQKRKYGVLGYLRAVSSIYGVDIQEDNVLESRERMRKLVLDYMDFDDDLWQERSYLYILDVILEFNIVVGDMLKGKDKITFFRYDWGVTVFGLPFLAVPFKITDIEMTTKNSVKK